MPILPSISIIVPIYNTEPYLKKCLDSLVNQTLENIEIICVNDCSPDNSLNILREYEKKDDRIKVVDFKENRGVSVARNEGVKIARGEYVGFVDSDDYVDLDFYEKLYKETENGKTDIVKGEIKKIIFDSKKNKNCSDPIHEKNFGYFFGNNGRIYICGAFSTCLYRTHFIKENKMAFPINLTVGEDLVFVVKAMLLAKKIKLVDGAFYYYVRHYDSADTAIYDKKKLISIIMSCHNVFDFINITEISVDDYLNVVVFYCKFLVSIITDKTNDNGSKTFVAREIFKLCDKIKKEYQQDFFRAIEKNNKNLSSFLKDKDAKGLCDYCVKKKEKEKQSNLLKLRKIMKSKYEK
jgi:glycosyltransferase involved in cell wall biosynthesis